MKGQCLLEKLGRKSKSRVISGVDFSSIDLSECNLEDYTFKKCIFSTLPTEIVSCRFEGCTFRDIDIQSECLLKYCRFNSCTFDCVVLSHGVLFGTLFSDCTYHASFLLADTLL